MRAWGYFPFFKDGCISACGYKKKKGNRNRPLAQWIRDYASRLFEFPGHDLSDRPGLAFPIGAPITRVGSSYSQARHSMLQPCPSIIGSVYLSPREADETNWHTPTTRGTMLLVSVQIDNGDFIPVASDMYHILARLYNERKGAF